jgi:hypothetical protein
MIVLAILATVLSLIFSWIVFMANAMSDSSAHRFEGGWLLTIAWIVTAALWLGWRFG